MLDSLYTNPHGLSCPWYEMTEKFGAPNVKWCEETLCQWISEPANTWSNVLYILVAIYFLFQWRNHPFLPLRYAPIGIFLMGTFSLIYHLSNFYPTQFLDFLGMFLCIYNLLMMNIHRLIKLSRVQYLSIYILLISLSSLTVHLAYISHIPVQATVLVMVSAIVVTEILCIYKKKGGKNYKDYFIGFIFLVLAASCSVLDVKRIWCDPSNHWLQGHAMWHILSALMIFYMHLYYQQLWNSKKLSQLH